MRRYRMLVNIILLFFAFEMFRLSSDYWRIKDCDERIKEDNRLIVLNHNDGRAYVDLWIEYNNKGDYEHALSAYNKAVELNFEHPNIDNVLFYQAHIYFNRGNFDQAIVYFNKEVSISPLDSGVYFYRGLSYLFKGNIIQSVSDFVHTFRYGWPSFFLEFIVAVPVLLVFFFIYRAIYFFFLLYLAHRYYFRGNLDRAIYFCDEVIELKPKFANIYVLRGAVYYKKGKYDQAIADWTKAIKLNAKNKEAYHNRAQAYYSIKRYDEAWADVQKSQDFGYKFKDEDLEFLAQLKKASGRS